MLSNIGIPGLVLILVIALVIFGPKKLPEIGRAMGQTLKEFKKSTKELTAEFDEDDKKTKKVEEKPSVQAEEVKEETTETTEKTEKKAE